MASLFLCSLVLRQNPIKTGEIFDALKNNKTITTLDMHATQLTPPAFESLATCLKVNNTLQTIYLGMNCTHPKDGPVLGNALCEALKVNSSLCHLDVAGNYLGQAQDDAITMLAHKNFIFQRQMAAVKKEMDQVKKEV